MSFASSEAGSTFQCSLDGAAFGACTSPATYSGLSVGAHAFDVRAIDTAGNTDPTPASHAWVVDDVPPDTTITSAPPAATNSTSASVSFSSSEAGSTFECSLDGVAYSACTSPRAYSSLSESSHTFGVRAIDAAGNVDPTPATRSWVVDTTPPNTTIDTAPSNPTNATSASFSFSASEPGSTFECQLDGGGYSGCTTPKSYSGLTEGSHTFQVRAVDPAGNLDASPAADTWTIDTTAPNTTIGSAPADPTNSTSATFSFTSSESGSTFECRLGAGSFAACSSPATYTLLSEGAHVFEVRAIDAAGNTDPTPASRSWTVDTIAPAAPVIENPAEGSTNNTGNFTLSGSAEAGATVEIFEGLASRGTTTAGAGGSWSKALTGVVDGSHSYTARATDAAGNPSAASNSRTIVVDTAAPNTTIGAGPAGSTASTGAIFSFSADDPAATFECSLDGAGFTPCTSPKSYNGLAETSHTFSVRATDLAGNTDQTPASRTWTVDVTPPAAPVITAPANGTAFATSSVTLSGTAEPGIFVEVFEGSTSRGGTTASAGGTWSKLLTGVPDGPHTYAATASDNAGNASPVSNTVTVTVDTTAPNTTISSAPASPTNATGASFYVLRERGGIDLPVSARRRRLFGLCEPSDLRRPRLTGAIPSRSGATDAVGHPDASPASHGWTVDTAAPQTSITSGPADPTVETDAVFVFGATAGSTFECSPDGATFTVCSSPATYLGLDAGAHLFEARAIDPAGNVDPTPAPTAGRSRECFGRQASRIPPARGCGA